MWVQTICSVVVWYFVLFLWSGDCLRPFPLCSQTYETCGHSVTLGDPAGMSVQLHMCVKAIHWTVGVNSCQWLKVSAMNCPWITSTSIIVFPFTVWDTKLLWKQTMRSIGHGTKRHPWHYYSIYTLKSVSEVITTMYHCIWFSLNFIESTHNFR